MKNNIFIIKKIRIGSTVFFKVFNDFKSKDIDELCIMSNVIGGKKTSLCMRVNKRDLILYPQLTKEEFIELDLHVNDSLKLGKYLVPEFIEYIGLNIEDLHRLDALVNKLDSKHVYEKIIYDAYITNNDFILTDDQLESAYQAYKNNRKN